MKVVFEQYIKFLICGIIATVVNLSVLYILTEFFDVWYIFSAVIGVLAGSTSNFKINRDWTFKQKRPKRGKDKTCFFDECGRPLW